MEKSKNVGASIVRPPYDKNAKKQGKGITLIALIITIIVMLILVGVSVAILINSNMLGIAQDAADRTKTSYEDESNLGGFEAGGQKYNSIDEYLGTKEEKLPEINAGERATSNSEYTDSTGDKAVIPAGFTVSGIKSDTADETTIAGGLVIYDIPKGTTVDWTNPDSVKTKYNQFVWIPVEVNKTTDSKTSIASFYRSNWTNSSDGGERTTGLSNIYTEPYSYGTSDYDGASGTGIAAQIEKLTESIYNYGGFYIGRYEAGSTTQRTSSSSQTASFVVQQDKYPYNYVKWGSSMSSISSGGAVYLSNNLYSSTNTNYGATSMLCTGACWDAMLDFVKDSNHNVTSSATWGNYYDSETYKVYRGSNADYSWTVSDTTNGTEVTKNKSILLTTGATERNSSKNIYDVAGNCSEWTTEASETGYRVLRGRGYNSSGSGSQASSRFGSYPERSGDVGYSFRPALYIN